MRKQLQTLVTVAVIIAVGTAIYYGIRQRKLSQELKEAEGVDVGLDVSIGG